MESGYWFGNGTVRERYFKDERDLINTYEYPGVDFLTSPKTIYWTLYSYDYRLNRQTLTLDKLVRDELRTRSICEVFNKNGYEKTWDELKTKYQNSYNKKLQKNKI